MAARQGGARGGAVSAAEAVRLINREKAVLIDVSEPAEFAAGHAPGARNVPLGTLEGSKALPTNKALPLVVVCPTGARASRGAAALRKLGFENAHALVRRPVGLARGQPAGREDGLITGPAGPASAMRAWILRDNDRA